ncbi:Alpha/Beta hydrolase protein [Pilobolus umbonatus]|nr:Alpha/Beta hydrolase protein [Pilobolus umbonatus]
MSQVKLFHHPDTVPLTLVNEGNRTVLFSDYIAETCPSLVGPKAVYHPTTYLFNGHLQTGYAAYYNHAPTVNEVVYERELLDMPDGGTVALDWAPTSKNIDKENTPTLLVLHGLTGGSHESYIRALLEVLVYPPFNYRAVVMNCRGCANSDLITPQTYSGGYTQDLKFVLSYLSKTLPTETPLIGIGYSLGSNILVKYLGEEGSNTPLKAAISVANPFDFTRSMEHLNETFLGRNVYSPAMATNLKNAFTRHLSMMAQGGKIDPEEIMACKTLREFDEACTSKMFDFKNAKAYYHDASSSRFIDRVKIPLLCLNALDDPIAYGEAIPYAEIKSNPNVVLATTDLGGHIGWFEHLQRPTRWMIKPLSEFIAAMFQAFDTRQNKGADLTSSTIDDAVDELQHRRTEEQTA